MESGDATFELPQPAALAAPSSSSNGISSSAAEASAVLHDNASSASTVSTSASRKGSTIAAPRKSSAMIAQQHLQYLAAAFKKTKSRTQHTLQDSGKPPQSATGAANGRQRSTSLMAPNKMPRRMTQNYHELARDFRMLKPFTRLPDGTYPPETRCVFCEIGSPKTVFFPCQHKCVCDVCIQQHDISSDRSHASAWSACPVCMTDIRLVLPYSGKEEDEYWKWISEVKPSLPHTFKLEFKEAAKRLSKNAVLPGSAELDGSNAPSHHSPTLEKQPSVRRHTWHSNNQSASQQSADPKTCSIL